jgi:LuxR family maltose regulon positive regulatory protein
LHAVEGIDAAEPLWAGTLWRAESIEARPLAAVARAMRAMAAIRRDEWDAAETIVNDAINEMEEGALGAYITSALAHVQAARIAAHKGNLDLGRSYLGAASRMRPLLTVALPIYSVLTLQEEAMAYIEFADIAGARRLVRDAADILAMRPQLGTLVKEHDELRERLAALPAGTVGPSSLTGAELRLLPLLVTHLTYPEIGERLYVSKHTVKTQAMSIYRKLGVPSRNDAVETARTIGLISA